MMKKQAKHSLLILFSIISTTLFSQTIDPAETGKALLKDAYKRAYNIEAGFEVQSLLVMEGKAGFGDYFRFMPNTFSYYANFPTESKLEHSNTYLAMDWKVGKRMYTSTPEIADSISLFNCEKMRYYFIGTTLQISIKKPLGKHFYYSLKPGFYFDFLIGDMENEIINGSKSTDMVIVRHLESPQTIRPLDIGAAINAEFGFHAAYIGLSLREGLRNLAPENSGNTIRNNGLLNLHLGYRFASSEAKADQEKLNKIVPH